MVHFEGILRTEIIVAALSEYKKVMISVHNFARAQVISDMLVAIDEQDF